MANVPMGDVLIKKKNKIYTKMKENADVYVTKIQKEYNDKDYKINGETLNENTYRYSIQSDTGDNVCTIVIVLTTWEYKAHNTRSNATYLYNGIYIHSLDTMEKYRGQGHATKLLLYTICLAFLSFEDKHLFFVKLDDATAGNQQRMKGHIYHKIGFTPTGRIELNTTRKNYVKGADSGRDISMEYLLTYTIPQHIMKGGAFKQKSRKRKTKKNKRVL
jgi:GNAT superfamily N-acetyltransferase